MITAQDIIRLRAEKDNKDAQKAKMAKMAEMKTSEPITPVRVAQSGREWARTARWDMGQLSAKFGTIRREDDKSDWESNQSDEGEQEEEERSFIHIDTILAPNPTQGASNGASSSGERPAIVTRYERRVKVVDVTK